jgi:hypothetical protein
MSGKTMSEPSIISPPTAPAPASPPRELSAKASKRAWAEGRVRAWWLCGAVVLAVTTFYGISQTLNWWNDRKLITQGIAVDANIDEANGSTLQRKFLREEPVKVKLSFTLPDGTKQQVEGQLRPPGPAVTAQTPLPIHYDPKNPKRWTERSQLAPWAREMTVVWMILPVLALLFLIAFLQRRRMLGIWRNAPAAQAVVVDSRQTSIAPRSRVLRYALREGDRRVCQTLYPLNAGLPEPGETIWIIAPPEAPHRGIVAKLYEGE